MSASNKKKLRREVNAAKLTEKQQAAQQEAKKTRLLTIIFVASMAIILAIAVVFGVSQTLKSSGYHEKNTTAMTVGSNQISNAELNYYYMDGINSFSSNYGSYAAMFGLDTTKPLNEQVFDEATGETWADYFLSSAKDTVKATYALCDAASAAGYSLPQEQKDQIEEAISSLDTYAAVYGYSNGTRYLQAIYGLGANKDNYREYAQRTSLASAYQQAYSESLTYSDADLRAKEAENFEAYSSFSFQTYYLAVSRFLVGGTTDENGSTTYTDAEKADAVKAAGAVAKELAAGSYESVAAFDAAISELAVNADSQASSTVNTDTAYASISSVYSDWITDAGRKSGDLSFFESSSDTTDEAGNTTTQINGYYVVRFEGRNDNLMKLANVRHILVAFEGGTEDTATGTTIYSDEEKAAAKTEAEALLAQWQAGDATEDSFAALANEQSDDGNGTTGGLYENIAPNGTYVASFQDWAIADHQVGDTGIVETVYGYHIMYYVGQSEQTYRDYQIENELRSADLENWYHETVEAATTTDGDTKYIRTDLILNNGG